MIETQKKIQSFFHKYPTVRYEKGQIILYPEELVRDVIYLTGGQITEYDVTSSGNTLIVNVFKPGAFLPMSYVLNELPNEYFFEADTPVHAHLAPAADVIKFMENHPEVTFDLLRRVYRGTDGVLRRMVYLMSGSARNRLIFELINAANRYGKKDADGMIFIPLNEGDIAKRAGLSRETVSRLLQDQKKARIIMVKKGGLMVTDMSELESLLSL